MVDAPVSFGVERHNNENNPGLSVEKSLIYTSWEGLKLCLADAVAWRKLQFSRLPHTPRWDRVALWPLSLVYWVTGQNFVGKFTKRHFSKHQLLHLLHRQLRTNILLSPPCRACVQLLFVMCGLYQNFSVSLWVWIFMRNTSLRITSVRSGVLGEVFPDHYPPPIGEALNA